MKWERVTEHAAWDFRDSMGHVVFKDKMWVMGGWRPALPRVNDVWCSGDGWTWERVLEHAPWEPRNCAMSVVHDGRIWLMGGGDKTLYGDVWCTDDGRRWEQVCASAPWQARSMAAAVAFKGKLWVLGGTAGAYTNSPLCDVWASSNGADWEQVLDSAPWGKRAMHTCVVFQDRIWLMGGGIYHDPWTNHNDVWCSEDGLHWEAAVHTAPWTPRRFHVSAVFANRIWLAAGYTTWGHNMANSCSDLNDVWSSADGSEWTEANRLSMYPRDYDKEQQRFKDRDDVWLPRHAPGMLAFRDRLWVFGGGQRKWNDVWATDGV